MSPIVPEFELIKNGQIMGQIFIFKNPLLFMPSYKQNPGWRNQTAGFRLPFYYFGSRCSSGIALVFENIASKALQAAWLICLRGIILFGFDSTSIPLKENSLGPTRPFLFLQFHHGVFLRYHKELSDHHIQKKCGLSDLSLFHHNTKGAFYNLCPCPQFIKDKQKAICDELKSQFYVKDKAGTCQSRQ